MNLGKYDKQAIIEKILADLPKVDHDKLEAEIQEKLVKAMSAQVRRIYRANPKALRTVYGGYDYGLSHETELIVGDADHTAVLEPYKEAANARWNIQNKLASAFAPIKTRKQFVDTFPEFSAYAPPEAGKSTNLPAIANVVASLVQLGWEQKVSKS